ncbi:MAG: sensor domain-containing diguanylate cyclase [Gammaproteobacteria bacterium]|nr:sensor domain-containing diguanylate cyclase [Gammaproteobacteria bacterium]
MIEPQFPDNESERLETLRALQILDTPHEERFDRITRLARRLFGVPIALVSLVDTERQWFKSSQGLDASETPREISFCGHAILDDDALVIKNAVEDNRFADNPLVTGEPNIRFYAGQPLSAGNGCKVGTLCLIDTQPRELSEEDQRLLEDLAAMVEQEFTAMAIATIDELTGISNRRGFNMLADKALDTCKRQRKEVTLLAFDLNNFKEINDNLGHAAGDQALQDFAEYLTTTFRDSDIVGRMGGDEFWVLLCDAQQHAVPMLLNRLEEKISVLGEVKKRPFQLSYSVGIASCSPHLDMSIGFLGERADSAMYEQKRRKRHAAAGA